MACRPRSATASTASLAKLKHPIPIPSHPVPFFSLSPFAFGAKWNRAVMRRRPKRYTARLRSASAQGEYFCGGFSPSSVMNEQNSSSMSTGATPALSCVSRATISAKQRSCGRTARPAGDGRERLRRPFAAVFAHADTQGTQGTQGTLSLEGTQGTHVLQHSPAERKSVPDARRNGENKTATNGPPGRSPGFNQRSGLDWADDTGRHRSGLVGPRAFSGQSRAMCETSPHTWHLTSAGRKP